MLADQAYAGGAAVRSAYKWRGRKDRGSRELLHVHLPALTLFAHIPPADFVQAIGLASLGADDSMIWHLTKVYWWVVLGVAGGFQLCCCLSTRARTHAHAVERTQKFTSTHMRAHTHTHARTHARTHIHTYKRTHTHTHTHARGRYTVEFGVIREAGTIKAFGAGVLSSFAELEHMASGRAALRPFDPFEKQVRRCCIGGDVALGPAGAAPAIRHNVAPTPPPPPGLSPK